MTKTSWSGLALKQSAGRAMLALGVCFLCACGAPETTAAADRAATKSALTQSQDANPTIFPKDARPYGQSLEFWAEQWWRWVYSTPAEINPLLHPTLDSNQNQSGPVFFLAPGDRTNTIPADRAIAVTPSTLANDFPCPDPTFQPAEGQSLFDFLLSGIKPVNDAVVEIDATLDGQPLHDLLTYRFISDDLTYLIGDLSLQTTFDSCVTGSSQPAVVDAFLFILKPLEAGPHVLTTRVVNQAGHAFTHTQQLNVQ